MFNQFMEQDNMKKVFKWAAFSLMFFAVFLLVKIVTDLKRLPTAGREVYPQSTITVTGKGEAYAIPDIATFMFTTTEVGDTVSQAQEKSDLKINKALSAIREAGIEENDIKTTNYGVYPKYEWEDVYCIQSVTTPCPRGKNVLKGYEVTQSVSVKVRDTEKAADLVTKVGATGVSSIGGLEFTVDDREKYVVEAREEAIKKAKEQAKVLSKQLGVRLGKILYYNDNSGLPFYGEGMGGDMIKSAATFAPPKADLPQGETKITSEISITYEIK